MTEEHPAIVQIDADTLDKFVAAQRSTFKALVAFMLTGALVAGLVVGFLVWRSFENQTRSDCIARIEGNTVGSALQALAAPPVPTDATAAETAKTPRGVAVARGLAAAAKLQNPDRYC